LLHAEVVNLTVLHGTKVNNEDKAGKNCIGYLGEATILAALYNRFSPPISMLNKKVSMSAFNKKFQNNSHRGDRVRKNGDKNCRSWLTLEKMRKLS